MKAPTATILIPCLNESKTLPALLADINTLIASETEISWSVLVADNGSTDDSPQIAKARGAQVVNVPRKGYGAALNAGIRAVKTDWVVFLDADGTYRPEDAIALVKAAVAGRGDMLLGSRLVGTIHPGAMPLLHRYLGTPVLTTCLKILYGVSLSDCNSGVRAFRPRDYIKWDVRANGMEFASLLLIQAIVSGARIAEIPVHLKKGPTGRVPHLKSWRDGMRHLLTILVHAPRAFLVLGAAMLGTATTLSLLAALVGMTTVFAKFTILGPHTQILALMVGFLGVFLLNTSLSICARRAQDPEAARIPRIAKYLLEIDEGSLFWLLTIFGTTIAAGSLGFVVYWAESGFSHIDSLRFLLTFIFFTLIPTQFLLGLFQSHLLKRNYT